MHRALLISEIVDLILCFMSLEDLARASSTCKMLYSPTQAEISRRQQTLRDIISFLPPDLVCDGGLSQLLAYSGAAIEESHFPATLSAVLPNYYRIHATDVSQMAEAQSAFLRTHSETAIDINFMNWPPQPNTLTASAPSIAPAAAPAAALETSRPTPFQFVKVFQREPAPEDLHTLLREARRCSILWYSSQDHKAFLVIHALERLFPSIDFFPNLKEIVLISSPNDDEPPFESFGVCAPFSLVRRATTLTINDERIGTWRSPPLTMRSSEEKLTGCLSQLPQASFNGLRVVTYTTRTRPYGIYRGLQPAASLRPLIVIGRGAGSSLSLASESDGTTRGGFSSPIRYVDLPRNFRTFLRKLNHTLHSLKVTATPSIIFWQILPTFRALQELELGQAEKGGRSDTRGAVGGSFDPFGDGSFPQLRKLTCRRNAIAMLSGVFRSIRFPCLTDVIVEAPDDELDVESIGQAIGLISQHVPRLRYLSIDAEGADVSAKGANDSSALISAAAIEHLMTKAPMLEYLHITCSSNTVIDRIDNVTILRMAIAWPHLTHLFLDPLHSPLSTVTLEGLIPFARRLRRLNTLGLGLALNKRATRVVNDRAKSLGELDDHRGSSMKHLDLGAPWPHDIPSCAHFLRILFPSLRELSVPSADETHVNFSTDQVLAWAEVASLIEVL